MAMARTFVKVVGGLFFTVGIALAITMVVLANLTAYDSLKPIISGVLGGLNGNVDTGAMNATMEKLKQACEGKDTIELPMSETETAVVDCNEVRRGATVEDIVAGALLDKIYYKQYSCGFIDCIKSGELGVVFSEQGHAFFSSFQVVFLAVTALGAGLILVAADNWPSRLKSLGIPMIGFVVPYIILEFVLPALVQRFVPAEASGVLGGELGSVASGIINPVKVYFFCIFAAGLALTLAGFALGKIRKPAGVKIAKVAKVAKTAKKKAK